MAPKNITGGTPVELELGGIGFGLCAENHDGRQFVFLGASPAVNQGVAVELSPDEAELLADVLHGLARAGS